MLPRSLREPEPLPPDHPFAQGLAENARDIAATEQSQGRDHPDLILLLSYRTNIQEFAGDILGALASQERMVALGERHSTPPDQLAKGYGRLARLYREVGRRQDAVAAERRGHELAIHAANLN